MIAATVPLDRVAQRARSYAHNRTTIESLDHFARHFQDFDRFDDDPTDMDLLEAIHIVRECFGWSMSLAVLFLEDVLVEAGDELPQTVDRAELRACIDGILDCLASIQRQPI